jgi:hypothetical protein
MENYELKLQSKMKSIEIYPIDEDNEIEIQIEEESIWLTIDQTKEIIVKLSNIVKN